MATDFDILARKTAEYIGIVQPQLDRLSSLEAETGKLRKQAEAAKAANAGFAKRATVALGALADAGVISKNDVTRMVDRSVEDHSSVWGLVEKLAESIGPVQLGTRSQEVETTSVDPFMREFGNYDVHASTGMID